MDKMDKYDFCGWATRNNVRCSDGRTIRQNAFADCDGKVVPLVWNHQHDSVDNVLGHALLKNRPEGVYTYGVFNNTELAHNAKEAVNNGDIVALSIYANQLKQNGGDVVHGMIREVSLVLAGANPGAYIESVISHGEMSDEEAIIYTGEDIMLYHSDDQPEVEDISHADNTSSSNEESGSRESSSSSNSSDENKASSKTVGDIVDTMNEEQQQAFYGVLGVIVSALDDIDKEAAEDSDTSDDNKEGTEMKHNVFEGDSTVDNNVLTHDAMEEIIRDGKRYGSLKESFLAHAADYGVDPVDWLFPEPKTLTNTPEFISRDTGWVAGVMRGVHHSPFSRIKSVFADITEDDARAKGYIKGNMKKEEFFSLIKRTTTPTTVYKKQKMDRDDIIDITDFDVVSWLKTEMRGMLDEELARAYLIGDGRPSSSDDKIPEDHIRPIWKDDDLFTIKSVFKVANAATEEDKAKAFIKAAIRARKNYRGSGNPTLYTTEDVVTECLLLTDEIGRDLYESEAKLAQKLRVSNIVTVEVMEGQTRQVTSETHELWGLIVNLSDYNVGADRGGAINMFEDFDIDYNQEKYLIETRCSGALTKPYSAIALECVVASA